MTLFELLKEGCTIEFPCGYVLKGDPESNYIDTFTDLAGVRESDGLRPLTKEGTREALADARHYAKRIKEYE